VKQLCSGDGLPGVLPGREVWELATALSGAVTSHDVTAAIAAGGATAAGASFCSLLLFDDVIGEAAAADTARCRDHLRANGTDTASSATVSLPLRSARGSVVGTVTFGWPAAYQVRDEQLARLSFIADLCGQALDRALAYERERTQLTAIEEVQADLLQQAFLPASLPDTPGLEVAAAYLPASGAPLGGDWFDVLGLRDGVCLVIGDVAGHGLQATAVMAELRNAIRALACDTPSPSRIVSRANRMLCELEPDATATAIVAVCEPSSQLLVRTNAGHPPPLRCSAGDVEFLEPPDEHVLLGVLGDQMFTEEKNTLQPGSTLLFYTDGLIEDRHRSLDDGMADLLRFVEGLGDLAPNSLCQAVVRWRSERIERDDDMCVMAVRVTERRSADTGRSPERRLRCRMTR
jgi:serine phosphatase RsbU (regulator of sigma subunit)